MINHLLTQDFATIHRSYRSSNCAPGVSASGAPGKAGGRGKALRLGLGLAQRAPEAWRKGDGMFYNDYTGGV